MPLQGRQDRGTEVYLQSAVTLKRCLVGTRRCLPQSRIMS
jgi:hypothetical protein